MAVFPQLTQFKAGRPGHAADFMAETAVNERAAE
jgi:hypothetical protein